MRMCLVSGFHGAFHLDGGDIRPGNGALVDNLGDICARRHSHRQEGTVAISAINPPPIGTIMASRSGACSRDTLAVRGVHADLFVYADEGHGLAKLKNQLDAYPKVAAFLAGVFSETSSANL